MKRATRHKLHDEKDLLVRIKGLIELRYVLVIEFFHYLDFSFDPLLAIGLKQFELLVYFGSYSPSCLLMQAHPHHCIGALPDALANIIIVEVLRITTLCAKL